MNNDDASNSGKIIFLQTDFETLKAETEKLRTEFSMLVLERDELLYHDCRNIEMAYMLSIGALEYKAYEIECAVLRLKRKIELIQAKKNRQEKVILTKIEEMLDTEFAKYKAKLDEQIGKMNAAIERSNRQILAEDEKRELKRLYRAIVKVLHPDMNPGLSEEKLQLFYNAVDAYERGDLNALRIMDTMASEPALPDEMPDKHAFLIKEKERLASLLKIVADEIVNIKSEYPYIMKDLLRNEDNVEKRKAELEAQTVQLKEALAHYTAKLKEMLG